MKSFFILDYAIMKKDTCFNVGPNDIASYIKVDRSSRLTPQLSDRASVCWPQACSFCWALLLNSGPLRPCPWMCGRKRSARLEHGALPA